MYVYEEVYRGVCRREDERCIEENEMSMSGESGENWGGGLFYTSSTSQREDFRKSSANQESRAIPGAAVTL